jgi:hypothetical protein
MLPPHPRLAPPASFTVEILPAPGFFASVPHLRRAPSSNYFLHQVAPPLFSVSYKKNTENKKLGIFSSS